MTDLRAMGLVREPRNNGNEDFTFGDFADGDTGRFERRSWIGAACRGSARPGLAWQGSSWRGLARHGRVWTGPDGRGGDGTARRGWAGLAHKRKAQI